MANDDKSRRTEGGKEVDTSNLSHLGFGLGISAARTSMRILGHLRVLKRRTAEGNITHVTDASECDLGTHLLLAAVEVALTSVRI